MNTVDAALEDLEALGVLLRHPEPGSNVGQQYELLTLEENPTRSVDITMLVSELRQAAMYIERAGLGLTTEELLTCLELAHRARRFMSDHAQRQY